MSDDVLRAMAKAMADRDHRKWGTQEDLTDQWMIFARAALSAIEDAGWVVVPVEPDNAMETLGAATFQVSRTPDSVGRRPSCDVAARAIYRAMVSARPRITGETT